MKPHLSLKKDVVFIVLFFILYSLGYAWLVKPKKMVKKSERSTLLQREQNDTVEKQRSQFMLEVKRQDFSSKFDEECTLSSTCTCS